MIVNFSLNEKTVIEFLEQKRMKENKKKMTTKNEFYCLVRSKKNAVDESNVIKIRNVQNKSFFYHHNVCFSPCYPIPTLTH